MHDNTPLLSIGAVVVILNLVTLLLGWRRINYRNYYFALLFLTLIFLFIAVSVFRSYVTWGLFGGQFIFLAILSIRNFFRRLDKDVTLVSRIIAGIVVAAVVLLLIFYGMSRGRLTYG